MTLAFRIFLLMIAAFCAVWASRMRSEDIARWLAPRVLPEPAETPEDPLVSPLSGVPSTRTDLGWLRLNAWPERPALRAPEAAEEEPPPEEGDPAVEEDSDSADLVVEEVPEGAEVAEEAEPEDIGTREEPKPEPFQEVVYELQRGENLWKVAERFLGSGSRYREICELNQDILRGRDPAALPAGTKLRVRIPAGSPR